MSLDIGHQLPLLFIGLAARWAFDGIQLSGCCTITAVGSKLPSAGFAARSRPPLSASAAIPGSNTVVRVSMPFLRSGTGIVVVVVTQHRPSLGLSISKRSVLLNASVNSSTPGIGLVSRVSNRTQKKNGTWKRIEKETRL